MRERIKKRFNCKLLVWGCLPFATGFHLHFQGIWFETVFLFHPKRVELNIGCHSTYLSGEITNVTNILYPIISICQSEEGWLKQYSQLGE
jgi:hypothetical protein